MTLQQLDYALALRRHKNYSRAAEHMGISQPAMSIQIKKLEEETSLKLFDRQRNAVLPTQEGLIFLERAQLLLTQARQLSDLAAELNDDFVGELRIGVIPTLAPYILPLFIKNLNEEFPRLKIHVKEAITEEVIRMIKSGDLDGGIISTPIESQIKMDHVPLFYEGFKLFVSTDHELYHKSKVNVKDIPIKDLWLLSEGNCFRDQVNNICELAKKGDGQNLFFFESNSIEALCRIVEFKGGITFLPELTTLHFGSEHEEMIKDLLGTKRVREISLVSLPNTVRQYKLQQLAKVIQNNIPKNLLNKGKSELIPTNVQL
jgi:LysR family hydrogen peroxide-inducible transcriptional activator